jgi:hypothetical protein
MVGSGNEKKKFTGELINCKYSHGNSHLTIIYNCLNYGYEEYGNIANIK